MVRNYLKSAFRGLKKNKLFSIINISGLSLGLACYLLILLYTKDELSYDRFHDKAEHIYQLTCNRIEKNGTSEKFAIAAMVQGPAFKREVPEIEQFVRVSPKNLILKIGNSSFNESITWVDQDFFSLFSFELKAGQPEQVLAEDHAMVVTQEIATKYFGTTDAVGKIIQIEIDGKFEAFTITGIAKRAPENSSIKFNVLLPFSYLEKVNPDNGWGWVSYPTYFLLRPDADPKAVSAKMERIYQTQAKSEIDLNHLAGYDNRFIWGLEPLTKMHLNTAFKGVPDASNPIYAYILTAIGIFILAIACINFINLSIAQSLKRGKEIGVRKVIGGLRIQLIRQFLGETFFICFIAFVLALLLTQLALPTFNELANKQLSLGYLIDGQLLAGFAMLYLCTGFLAGSYPALVLSGLNPVHTLYNRTLYTGKNILSRALVTVQFVLATILIISTFFLHAQFNYLTKAELGYQEKNLIEFDFPGAIMNKRLMDLMKNQLSSLQGIEDVAYRNVGHFGGKTIANEREITATYTHIDEHYLPTMGTNIVKGRNFLGNFPSDSISSVIVNETFAKQAGWKDPVGKTVDFMNLPDWGNRKINVIGVVKDFHDESLRETIKPQVFTMDARLPLGHFLVRTYAGNIQQTIKSIETVFQQFMPDHPFSYTFREEVNKAGYLAELKWKQIITISTALTIFISCIGLFGLAVLSTERRRKEIGIRKVMGASIGQMVFLAARGFMVLVLISFMIAVPFAWYAMNKWLQNFAYRIELSWWIFAAAGMLTLIIALVTVSFQALKAALADPVKALQAE
jgi:putative ABC transport system permease protein